MTKPQGKLAGKVVLITGGARRIGRALALAVAGEGARVAITYRSSERDAEHTIERLQAQNAEAMSLRCDVRDPLNVQETVREVASEFGAIDVLVNNAGVFDPGTEFEKITTEQWDLMLATNTRGPFLVSREAVPYLRRRRGRIIHISSLGGLEPWAQHAHYCSSKAALIMLTQVMAKALAPRIAVNCIAPGMIPAGDHSNPTFTRAIAKNTPMKRPGTPADVAEAVLFFATATHFITGQTLAVDGGLGL
jgi:NAD(P)-dependent dehydrogenase (short-subunit alcohol dehydrogenase family)